LTIAQSPTLIVPQNFRTPESEHTGDSNEAQAGPDTLSSVGAIVDDKLSSIIGDGVVDSSSSSILMREEVLSPLDMSRFVPIIFAAVRHNKYDTVEKLLRDYPNLIDAVDESNRGNSLLHVACINGYARVARLLLKSGINIDGTNADGNTPLHLCYQYGRNQLVSILISSNANENARNIKDLIPAQMISGSSIPSSINPSPMTSPPSMTSPSAMSPGKR
jgi:hypothetical protein